MVYSYNYNIFPKATLTDEGKIQSIESIWTFESNLNKSNNFLHLNSKYMYTHLHTISINLDLK